MWLVGPVGVEPTSRPNLGLQGYKPCILPLNYGPKLFMSGRLVTTSSLSPLRCHTNYRGLTIWWACKESNLVPRFKRPMLIQLQLQAHIQFWCRREESNLQALRSRRSRYANSRHSGVLWSLRVESNHRGTPYERVQGINPRSVVGSGPKESNLRTLGYEPSRSTSP